MTNKDVEKLIDQKVAQALSGVSSKVSQLKDELARSQRDTALEVFKEELPVILLDGLPAAVDEWRQRPLVVKLHALRHAVVPITADNPKGEQSIKPRRLVGCTYGLYYAPPADFGVNQAKVSGAGTGIAVEHGSCKTVQVYAGFSVRLPTGIVIGVPNGFVGCVQSVLQCGLTIVGGVQSVHQGDCSEIVLVLRNEGTEKVSVQPGACIALLSFVETSDVAWQSVEDVLSCAAFVDVDADLHSDESKL